MKLRDWVEKQPNSVEARKAIAEACDLTEPAVRHWCNGTRSVPARRCLAIEEATGGKVTRYDLRPDIFGTPPKGVAA